VDGTKQPECRNLLGYYKRLADGGVDQQICIRNNAFLCDYGLEEYTVGVEIEYVGNTAFSYCLNLTTIRFERVDTLFGKFPIIECPKLKSIIVPECAVDYYRSKLPYYRDIIMSEAAYEDAQENEIEEQNCVAEEVECEQLLIGTDQLKNVFKHKSTSYKYFWLLSILELLKEEKIMTFENLTIKMLSQAWMYVVNNSLSLGPKDQLGKHIGSVCTAFGLSNRMSHTVVEKRLTDNPEFVSKNVVNQLLKDVPYRFLSPWIKYTSNSDVIAKSNDPTFFTPYALLKDCIVMDEDWHDYFAENYDEIYMFAKNSLIEYLKQYNSPLQLLGVMSQ
jgi:hypothetical protein